MSIPKEPRQLMINLMYLVLTAMLALNISSEILHAFKILNESMTKSNSALDAKNNETMLAFQVNEDRKESAVRVKPYNDKAKEIKKKADDVFNFLESQKKMVIDQAGGFVPGQPGVIKDEANIDASTLLLVEKKGGDKIKQQIAELKTFIVDRMDPAAKARFEKDLPLQTPNPEKDENNPQGDWSTGTFYHVPTLGVIALMSKFQSDVRNAEQMAINQLFLDADAKQFKFDAITALAIPKTTYVLQGQPVEAQIMFAAYNKSVNPDIRSNSGGQIKIQDGVGTWTGTASGLGEQSVRGTLSLQMGDHMESQPWEFKYMVGSAGASMQLTKMNVFYIGVDNPIAVTAAGYSLEDVSVNIPGADVVGSKGSYVVNVKTPGVLKAAIMAKSGGVFKQVGGMDVRVKRIPDPLPLLGGKGSGPMSVTTFKAQAGVAAVLVGFDFEAKFTITNYSMSVKPRNGDYFDLGTAPTSYWNKEMAAYLQRAKIGDRVFIDNIKAKGPDGTTRNLGSISLILTQ